MLAALLSAGLLGAGDAPTAGPKSPPVIAALRRADAAVVAARKAFETAVTKARTQELADLRVAKAKAASRGDRRQGERGGSRAAAERVSFMHGGRGIGCGRLVSGSQYWR